MYKVVDLFAGVGGFSQGFKDAGFEITAAVEKDKVTAYYHSINFPDCRVIVDDIRNVTGEDIFNTAEINHVDVVIGGSPCQGFSVAGKRNPADIRNDLAMEYVRIVKELLPSYFVFENVPGMIMGYAQDVLLAMRQELEDFYVIPHIQLLNAKDYGVPQDRTRLIMLGRRRFLPEIHYPNPLNHQVTVGEALQNMGENPITTIHTPEVIERFKTVEPGTRDKVSRCHKLQLDGFCPTLKAGTAADKGNFTAVRPIHPTENRVITVKEAARLHSFPDHFKFHPATMWALRQIGNSVCPKLAHAIAIEVKQSLDKSYD
jgi:DNA (cytosine-5)-methyltransferase 1